MIYIKLVMMALLWAGGLIAGKVLILDAGPFTISFFRFLIAGLILSAWVLRHDGNAVITRKAFVLAFAAAFVDVICYKYFLLSGMNLVEAGRGAVVVSLVPAAVFVLSAFLFKERLTFFKSFGVALSIFGAWVVVSKGNLGVVFQDGIGVGETYLFIGVACAAVFSVLSKKLLEEVDPLKAMLLVFLIGVALLFVPALWEIQKMETSFLSSRFFFSLMYISTGPTVLGLVFYYQGINQIGPAKASQYMNLMPVFAVVLGGVFFGESLSVSLAFGGALVLTGLYLTSIQKKKGGEFMDYNSNFKNRIEKFSVSNDALRITSLLYLQDAIASQKYEDCEELIKTARGFGVDQEEINKVLSGYVFDVKDIPSYEVN